MLNAEETVGAVVAGYSIPLEGKSFDEVQELVEAAEAAGAKLFVAGDTSSGSGEEEFMEEGVIGFEVVIADVGGPPMAVTRAAIDAALAKAGALAGKLEIEGLGELGTYLLSWGPLPAASLSVGVRHPAKEYEDGRYTKPDDAKLHFFSMQDMEQAWGPEGVDGVRVASVEFGEARRVDLSAAALAPKVAEAAAQVPSPSLFLTARYD